MSATNWTSLTDDQIKESYPLYPYTPNETLPLIVAGIFSIAFIYHIVMASMRGAWGYMWAFVLGLGLEVGGYAVRHISAQNWIGTKHLQPYAVSMLSIVLAPAFMAACLYAVYGRITRYVNPELSIVKHAAAIFVTTDIISILVQGAGSAMFSSTKESTQKLGKTLLVGGFVFQLIAFTTFLILSVVYYMRVKRDNIRLQPWNRVMFALWTACVLILVRSVYRFIEFATGGNNDGNQTGYILTHEWTFYAFEAVLCILATTVMSAVYPAFYLPRDKTETLDALPTAGWKA